MIPRKALQGLLRPIGYLSPLLAYGPNVRPAAAESLQLTYRFGRKRSFWSFNHNGSLLLLLGVLLVGVLGLHGYNQWQSRYALQQQLHITQQQAAEAAHLREQVNYTQQQIAALVVHQTLALPIVVLWEDITQRLADDTWLQKLDVQGQALYLQGFSADAAALIPVLAASPYLQQVSFASSVVRDPRTQKERFHIGADLILGKGE